MYSLGSFLQPCCEGKLYLDVIWVGDDDVVFASVFIPLMHKAPFFSFIGQAHTEANLNFGVKITVEKSLFKDIELEQFRLTFRKSFT